ncbi:MAG: AAA family ATPase [Thermoplasmatota archaeon]
MNDLPADFRLTKADAERALAKVSGKSLANLLRDQRPRVTLVENVLPEGPFVLVPGKPMAGKSWFVEELCIALASGTPFMGHFAVPHTHRVLLLDQDTPTDELTARLGKMSRPGAEERLKVVSQEGICLDTKEGIARLAAEIGTFGAEVVVIDSLSSCLSGAFNENSSDAVRFVFQTALKRMQAQMGRFTLVVVHHLRKGPTASNLDNVRGSGAIVAQADILFEIYGHGEAGRFVVKPIWKRIKMAAPPFLAEIRDEPDGRLTVVYVRDCYDLDPELEARLEELVNLVHEFGPGGATVKELRKSAHEYFGQTELRKLLDLAVERGLLVRRREASNRFHFWTPAYAPPADTGLDLLGPGGAGAATGASPKN